MSRRQRTDRLGRPIKSQADYAQMLGTALVLTVLFAALFAASYWVNQQYALSQQVELPEQVMRYTPQGTLDICVPLALAGLLFAVLMNFVATILSRFYRNPKDELDEDGMYKHRDEF